MASGYDCMFSGLGAGRWSLKFNLSFKSSIQSISSSSLEKDSASSCNIRFAISCCSRVSPSRSTGGKSGGGGYVFHQGILAVNYSR